MEIIAIDEANGIVTVEVAPKAYVDVKGERYVMQNEDGSTVYLGTGLPCGKEKWGRFCF